MTAVFADRAAAERRAFNPSQRDLARFWARVDRSAGLFECWPWTGGHAGRDYGGFYLDGRIVLAHRFSLSVAIGHWLDRSEVACHRCDNPPCVNPAHLFVGSQLDNVADMIAKGRKRLGNVAGERNGAARLTEADVREIRRLAAEGMTRRATAELFGVHTMTVQLIVSGKTWAEVR